MNVKLEMNFWVQYFLAPELQLFVSSLEKCANFTKTSTPQKFKLSEFCYMKIVWNKEEYYIKTKTFDLE